MKVAIIGSGIAGLTAAEFLHRNGVPFLLFEASGRISGMAQSHVSPDGFSHDVGAHFITNRLASAIGVGSQCRDVLYYGESVWLNGRTYSYPFGLMRVPRFLAGGIAAKLGGAARERTAAAWFRRQYGRALADEVALPLLEAWSGATADRLSAAVGDKLQHGIGYTAYLKLASRWTGRAVANGYSHEMPESPAVWHVYPEGGVSLLCEKLAADIQGAVELESPVEKIYVEGGRAVGIRAKGRDMDVAAVVNTAPIPILAKMSSGSDALQGLAQFRYRPMTFVNLRLNGRGVLPDTVMWTPGRDFPFFRLTETPLSMPWLAPEGKTLITADIGCERGDSFWTMADDRLGEVCLEGLERMRPGIRARYLGCSVMRTPIAYPVFAIEYEAERQRLEQGTGIEGLVSIGRNGEFAHILMEDIYWRTRRKMGALADWLQARPKTAGAAAGSLIR